MSRLFTAFAPSSIVVLALVVALEAVHAGEPLPMFGFLRADANADGAVDLSDPVFSLASLFLGGPFPVCLDSADANDDAAFNISDAIYTLSFLFLGGSPPPAPFSDCALAVAELGCETPACAAGPEGSIEWVTVGDPGNDDDDTGFGAVGATYRISKYEVSNSQWAVFLNAVDATGANALGLYDDGMDSDARGGNCP